MEETNTEEIKSETSFSGEYYNTDVKNIEPKITIKTPLRNAKERREIAMRISPQRRKIRLLKIFIIIIRYLFDFSNFTKDERDRRYGMIFIAVLTASVSLLWGVINIIRGIIMENYSFSAFVLTPSGLLIAGGLILCIKNLHEFYIYFFNSIICVGIIVLYFFNPKKKTCIIYSAEIQFLSLCPLIALLLSAKRIPKYVFFIIYVSIILTSLIYEFVFVDLEQSFLDIKKNYPFAELEVYTVIFIPTVLIFLCFFYLSYKRSAENKILMQIVCALSNLEIESEKLLKLKGKKKKECSQIEIVFKKLISRISELISYLPENLKLKNHIGSDASSFNSNDYNSPYCVRSNEGGEVNDCEGENEEEEELEAEDLTKTMLKEREVTIFVVNVYNFHSLLYNSSTVNKKAFIEEFEWFSKLLLNKVKKYNGNIMSFQNDKIVCTFNGVRRLITHSLNALKCAWEFYSCCKKRDSKKNEEDCSFFFRICISTSTYSSLVGNIGCEGFKRPCLISPQLKLAFLMENIGKNILGSKWKQPKYEILICENTRDMDVRYYYEMFMVDIVSDCEKKAIRIFKIVNSIDINENAEWMYQLHQNEIENTENELDVKWMNCWKMLEMENYKKALDLTNEISLTSTHGEYLNLLKKKIKNKCAVSYLF